MTIRFGEAVKVELYGASHGPCVGVRIEGLPAGKRIDGDRLQAFLRRRAPGRNAWSTARKEADRPVFLSGVDRQCQKDSKDPSGEGQPLEEKQILMTNGDALVAEIRNTNIRPQDYDSIGASGRDSAGEGCHSQIGVKGKIEDDAPVIPRPAHADYPAWVKYGRIESGGGQFSARLTAGLCIAGGIFLQWLEDEGVTISAHIASIGFIDDQPFDPMVGNIFGIDEEFPVIDQRQGEAMKELIAETKAAGDSVGGSIECQICGLPPGIGEPLFGSIESRICQSIFTVPAVKGIEFGAGFDVSRMRGSENNDAYVIEEGEGETPFVRTGTNHHGGILGGLSSGMPILFRVAMKPTPSIGLSQQSVDLIAMQPATLKIRGRHDPCIVPRAVPCIEAAAALAVWDLLQQEAGEEESIKETEDAKATGQNSVLETCRKTIDGIDGQIIRLLEQRFDTVSDVADFKRRTGRPVLDEKREAEKLAALQHQCIDERREYISRILQKMMEESRKYQKNRLREKEPIRYGLLGRGLTHSHSPRIHQMLGGYEYGLFHREPEQLDDFFRDDSWRGISVTMPYKREVMKYCDEISAQAVACNSVNTIVRQPLEGDLSGEAAFAESAERHPAGAESRWHVTGHNTDYDGFRYVAEHSGIDLQGRKTLVLGSGGVSGTVAQVMRDLGAEPVIIVSRSGEDNYSNISRHEDAVIIVNATPAGMFPETGAAAVDITRFPGCEAVYDLIYNPLRTKLMLDAERSGIPAFGGLPMLIAQAARAVELFGFPLRRSIEEICGVMEQDLENIVLIGMPGVGKTTVGRALAKETGRPFLDLDEEIQKRTNRTPAQIITEDGEDRFRETETDILKEIASAGGQVIAAGGGIVEREENRDLIRQNGRVIWLRRPLSSLSLQDRPISQSEGLEEIFRRREPSYRAWSDDQVFIETVHQAAGEIISLLAKDETK